MTAFDRDMPSLPTTVKELMVRIENALTSVSMSIQICFKRSKAKWIDLLIDFTDIFYVTPSIKCANKPELPSVLCLKRFDKSLFARTLLSFVNRSFFQLHPVN